MREIACKQQQRVLMAAHVSCSTWTCSAYKQDGPMRSSSTGGKSLVAIDHIAVLYSCCCGSECHFFRGCARLRFTAPCHPGLAIRDAREPALLLILRSHAVNQNHGIAMPFPSTCDGKVRFCELLCHKPQRHHVSPVWP